MEKILSNMIAGGGMVCKSSLTATFTRTKPPPGAKAWLGMFTIGVNNVYNQSVVKFLQQNLTALGLHTRENKDHTLSLDQGHLCCGKKRMLVF